MLRRTQTITLKDDEEPVDSILAEPAPATPPPAAPAAENNRRMSFLDEEETVNVAPVERRRPDSLLSEIERAAGPKGERRRIDDLRAEVQRTLANPEGERVSRGPARPDGRFGWALRPSRILLLLVALFAGGTAAFLAVHRDPAPVPEAVQEVAAAAPPAVVTTRVLVASKPIGLGQRLNGNLVEWQDWPETAIRPEYVTFAAQPEAIADMGDAVVRAEFYAGEPIREQKLVRADRGYLSAVLEPGMRGVSVSVAAEGASGGFILPNDHVDVVLTRDLQGTQDFETILQNVRILAINARLGETGPAGAPTDPESPVAERFAGQALATLALDPAQSEAIINAARMGSLSLVLRSMANSTETSTSVERTANQSIRLSSPFWTE